MSVLLFKERLYADAAYYAFFTVNKGWFHIEHGRTVLALSQVLPLIGYYLGFPLKVLLVLWSLGHELFFYLLFLIILYPLKDRAGAFALLLVHLVGQLWMYYSPMYEIAYGAAIAVLFYSILRSAKYSDDKWLMLLLLAQWFAMMSHPENFLLIGLALAFHYFDFGWQKRIHLITGSFFLIGLVVEFFTFSEYEWSNTKGKFDVDASWTNLLDSDYLWQLGELFSTYFPDLLFMTGIALLLFVRRREGKKLLVFLGSILLILIAVNNKASAVSFIRYFESMYNPLVFLVAVPFAYAVFETKSISVKRLSSVLITLLLFGRMYWIWDYGKPMQERMKQWERIVDYAQTLGGSKYIIDNSNFEKNYSLPSWANPIEALLISACDGKSKSLSLITSSDFEFGKNASQLNSNNFLFRRYEIEDYEFLNDRFFELKQEDYSSLNRANFEMPIDKYAEKVRIEALQSTDVSLKKNDTLLFPVLIKNGAEVPLPSNLDHQVFISYHWLQGGEIIQWDGIRTPLEVDVWHEFVQEIKLATPEKPGVYEIQFDAVIEGKKWFGLSQAQRVKVN